MIYMINSLLMFLLVIISMTFYSLLERKVLGYIQIRKGPNKVGLIGVPQPLADAMKLFTKEMNYPLKSNFLLFMMMPMLSLLLALLLWNLYPSMLSFSYMNYGVLFFFCVSSFNVYLTLGSGWFSNSKYSLLGSLRSVAQTISYEISMMLILMSCMVVYKLYNMNYMIMYYNNFILFSFILFYSWFISILAETNRSPFDFVEGESELVSGFNVEFSGGLFAFIFMAEYLNILFMSLLSYIFFMSLNFSVISFLMIMMLVLFFSFMFLWIRGSYPRMRYDVLMMLTWKSFIPMSIGLLILYINIM